jgi:hypothetical protein
MLAWMTETKHKRDPEKRARPVATGVLYNLMVAFPSWAGAIVALYSVFLIRFGALKIRLR